ncbi:MAG TPA: rRNA adenine dimethyltransferase family protein, partial [Vicinamibacterales bacterium]|nr:rRNA adenine dimethyltransferase family protein [Vicinamibacterales bacterium]
ARRFPSVTDATLMGQHEFADRLTGRSGTKDYGVLTIFTAMAAEVRPLLELPPGAFRPVPKVRSALVRLTFRPPPVEVISPETFERTVRSVFTQRRKTISNAARGVAEAHGLTAADALGAAQIDPWRRPETLSLEEFARLANVLARN